MNPTLPARLKALRIAAGLTQSEFSTKAAEIGWIIKKASVSGIECKKGNLSVDTLQKWAKVCGYEMGIIFSRLNIE